MQTGSKKAITTASVRTTIQVLIAGVLVALVQKVPGVPTVSVDVLLPVAVALVVAGQQTVEHKFPVVAHALGNNGPILLAVLEHFREGLLDHEDEPGSVTVEIEPPDPSEESDALGAEIAAAEAAAAAELATIG